MTAITSTQALVVSLFCLSFLHGIYTVLEIAALYLIFCRRRIAGRTTNKAIILVIIAMYILTSAHVGMAVYQDFQGFADPATADQNLAKYVKLGYVQVGLVFLVCILADVVLVWRAWVIFDKSYLAICLPLIMVITSAVVHSINFSVLVGHKIDVAAKQGEHVLFNSALGGDRWNVAASAISISTNVLVTSQIAVKIWLHNREVLAVLGRTTFIWKATLLLIHSGAFYTITWILYMIMFATECAATVIMLDFISEVAGIIPTLIIVLFATGVVLPSEVQYPSLLINAPDPPFDCPEERAAVRSFSTGHHLYEP